MASDVKIQIGAPPLSEKEWDAWQMTHGSAFHATAYLRGLESLGMHAIYAGLFVDGLLVGSATAALRRIRGPFKNLGVLGWANFFAEPVFSSKANSDGALLTGELLKFCRHNGACFAQTSGATGRWSEDAIRSVNAASRSVRLDRLASLEIALSLSEEDLWNNLHSKHRNSIRSAEKAGVRIETRGENATDNEIAHFYEMLVQTLKRGGATAPSKEFVNNICRGWLSSGFAEIFTAYASDGIAVSSAIVPYTRARSLYWLGASAEKEKLPSGTGNLLQWKAILAMKAKGVKLYDVGSIRLEVEAGSKLEHIQKFKERFGGIQTPCQNWTADFAPIRAMLLRKAKQLLRSA